MNEIICCPRCEWKSFEKLQTYSHCINCLYIEDSILDFFEKDAFEIELIGHSKKTIKAREAMLASLYEF